MNPMRRWLLALLAAAVVPVTLAADANVTGEWDMAVETQAGAGTPHFSLKQNGNELTGTYKGALGEAPVTGTVKGNEISLKFSVSAQGVDFDVSYSGVVEGDTMKGKVVMGQLGEGTFSGKRRS